MYMGTYERLHVTVWASDREVIKAAARKLKPEVRFARRQRKARHALYREMLACHRAARRLVIRFRL
jgi:hypothetical protein